MTRVRRLHTRALLLMAGLIWTAICLGATDLFPT